MIKELVSIGSSVVYSGLADLFRADGTAASVRTLNAPITVSTSRSGMLEHNGNFYFSSGLILNSQAQTTTKSYGGVPVNVGGTLYVYAASGLSTVTPSGVTRVKAFRTASEFTNLNGTFVLLCCRRL